MEDCLRGMIQSQFSGLCVFRACAFLNSCRFKWVTFPALLHTAQYLLQTPMNKTFPVSLPIMIPTPDFALYECLWHPLHQPPSTMNVMAGTPWWYLL